MPVKDRSTGTPSTGTRSTGIPSTGTLPTGTPSAGTGPSALSLAALEALLTPPSPRTHTEAAAGPGDSSCIVSAGPTSFLVPLVQDHVTTCPCCCNSHLTPAFLLFPRPPLSSAGLILKHHLDATTLLKAVNLNPIPTGSESKLHPISQHLLQFDSCFLSRLSTFIVGAYCFPASH